MQVECGLWYYMMQGKMKNETAATSVAEPVPVVCGGWGASDTHCRSCHLVWNTPVRSYVLYIGSLPVKPRHSACIFGVKKEIVNIILLFYYM